MSDSLWPHGLYSLWNSPGQNTGVGSRSLLQGLFPTQESNQGLLNCRRILYRAIREAQQVPIRKLNLGGREEAWGKGPNLRKSDPEWPHWGDIRVKTWRKRGWDPCRGEEFQVQKPRGRRVPIALCDWDWVDQGLVIGDDVTEKTGQRL